MSSVLRRFETLTGWGRTSPSSATVWEPDQMAQVPSLVTAEGLTGEGLTSDPESRGVVGRGVVGRGVVGRGMGRSYGDAAQNAGGNVVSSAALDRIIEFDREAGRIRVEAGVSLDSLLRFLVPRGWFPTVIPGTSFVSVGGAIAADIHGKFRHGSFCDYVTSATLVTPDGARTIDAVSTPDEFWATAGGMGLTGVITEATLQLHPISTASMTVDTQRCTDVDDCMDAMMREQPDERYTVAWIDCLASGANLGRSILERGRHATPDELSNAARREPLRYSAGTLVSAPPWVPSGLLNALTIKAFNELWFRKSPAKPTRSVVSIPHFFHPLDMVNGWNRIYGKHGFVQYQFVVPYGHEGVVRRVLERLSRQKCGSFLAVLKRFEVENAGLLSFPMPGWTLALDLPASLPGLSELFDEFDSWVLQAGGRVYLAKDARVRPDTFAAMYPRLDEWRAIQRRLDPEGIMQSDLARRLHLVGSHGNEG